MDEELKRLADQFSEGSSGRRVRRVIVEFEYELDENHHPDDEQELDGDQGFDGEQELDGEQDFDDEQELDGEQDFDDEQELDGEQDFDDEGDDPSCWNERY